ncbi:uncharacterized protein [Argopecten irradians]|uniref:uncharacterized protein n=1 Tax=Argopecten irradians TaxID=31199 RepID=UPI003711EEB7
MHRHLKIFIKDLFREREMPRAINRRFYPSREDLRKIMYRQRRKTLHSLIDQEDLAEKIHVWQEDHPDDTWTFRKSSIVKRPVIDDDSEEDDGCLMVNEEESLLVIYQSKWQRNLLARYGNELVYLDATYRTTKYALPLFFLCVQTNGGFCVVGAFITEREDSSSVAEALQVIKDNNSAWTCKGFMIDSSEVEANAIHSVFPESKIYICDFHRKQAWHRWLIASKHGVTSQEQTSNLLNAVAESFTEDEFQQNLTRLHESQVWKTQPKLQNYINGQWLANDKHKTVSSLMTLLVEDNFFVEFLSQGWVDF